MAFSSWRHLLWIRSHTVSWGQQCVWSEQQMAWVEVGVGLCDFQFQSILGCCQVRQLALPQPPTRGWHES